VPERTVKITVSIAAGLAAAVPLCTALHEIHRRGFSHRELSPDSILLVDHGRKAVLRDLG
jgi:serine/threonine protein kinase